MSTNANLPDGPYVVEVVSAQFTRTEDGEAHFSWEFDVDQGTHAGAILRKVSEMHTPAGRKQFDYDLKSLGCTPTNREELDEFCKKVVGQRLAVRVSSARGSQRVFVNGFAKQNRKGQWFQVEYRRLEVA